MKGSFDFQIKHLITFLEVMVLTWLPAVSLLEENLAGLKYKGCSQGSDSLPAVKAQICKHRVLGKPLKGYLPYFPQFQ